VFFLHALQEKMLAGLETLGQVRDAMKKRLGTMQMQVRAQNERRRHL